MSEKEKRIRSITKLYYSNPKVQEAIFNFSKDREVVPRFFEGFGKRPDMLQYPSDLQGLVNKGTTSLHCSEELWENPLEINTDMSQEDLSNLRKSWDLLIDIDSQFLDYSKIAALLIIKSLEKHGVKNYGIKFSGSKGFHIIVPSTSFPEEYLGFKTKTMFPEWPRAISEYLMHDIKQEYNKQVSVSGINFNALKERTKLTREDIVETNCPNCGKEAKKSILAVFQCPECKTKIERPNAKITKRKLQCTQDFCPGYLELIDQKDLFFCESCKTSSFDKTHTSNKKITYTEKSDLSYSEDFKEEFTASKLASLDLVLVAPRHLFRMPYSLHEKTALASIVLEKSEIQDFTPKDANPLNIKIKDFYPKTEPGEATELLEKALSWKQIDVQRQETEIKNKYTYEKIDLSGITEDMFPKPIKKLLKGLKEGKKRGLFILLTFFKSLSLSPEYINTKIREWNKLNEPPLKEGYIKSQIDWHLRQKKQILPPNYSNESFYKDLNLIETLPKAKNPLVEAIRNYKKQNN